MWRLHNLSNIWSITKNLVESLLETVSSADEEYLAHDDHSDHHEDVPLLYDKPSFDLLMTDEERAALEQTS